jgi:hypothetical protein
LTYLRNTLSRGGARVTHDFHMFTARVASEPGGTKCVTARKSWCAAPNLFHVHTPRKHPADPPEHLEGSVRPRPGRGRPTRSRACFVITGGREGVNALSGALSACADCRVRLSQGPLRNRRIKKLYHELLAQE